MHQNTSQTPFADLEIRIFSRDARVAGYPVEITLDGERQLAQGCLDAGVVSLITDDDPVAAGQRLFGALFADTDLRLAWAGACTHAPRRRVRLRIAARVPELHALPWELLYADTLLSADANTPFSRYLSTPEAWGGAVKEHPIRVLVAISNPGDLDMHNLASLDVDVERTSLREASRSGQIRFDFLDPPVTLARIEQALQRAPGYHVLHYVGHGAFSRQQGRTALYLQDDEAYTRIVSGADFTAMLKRQSQPPRLVFLAACQSATPSTSRAYLGLGPKLVAAGVPAVIAMQDAVKIETARKLGQAFYHRLAEHGLVDCAMNEARSQLVTAGRPDAAVPVLFMRLKSGQLWSKETEAETAVITQPTYRATVTGSGAIAQGPGAVSSGEGGAAIKGDVHGNIIIGSHNVVTTRPTAFTQPTQPLTSPLSNSIRNAQPGNILILTVTKVEAQAVLDAFSQAAGTKWTRQVIEKKTYYNLGAHGGVPVFMVQSEPGTATPGGALMTVRQAIQDLNPQAVIMCGIAFGLRPDEQQLGDILIAKQIQYYEPQKVDIQGGHIPRGDRATSAERLLDRFRSADLDWPGAPLYFGLVLSGEKLVNDPVFRDWLLETEPEAVGGEMEGAGLYVAARDAKVDWILAKAVCDWADGKKDDEAHPLAASNAAQFVLHVLRLGGWGEDERLRGNN